MDKAVKDLVRHQLERRLRNDVQEIMNKAVEATLDMISTSLIVKFVPAKKNTFTVEFAWKDHEISEYKVTK